MVPASNCVVNGGFITHWKAWGGRYLGRSPVVVVPYELPYPEQEVAGRSMLNSIAACQWIFVSMCIYSKYTLFIHVWMDGRTHVSMHAKYLKD